MKTSPSHLNARHLLAATAATLLAVACNRQATETSRDSAPARPQRASKASTAPAFRPAATAFDWRVGDTGCFAMEVGFAMGKPDSDPGHSPDPAKGGLAIRGTYHLGVLSVDGDTIVLAASFSHATVLNSGERSPAYEELVNATPAVLTLGTDGSVRKVAFPAETPEEDRQILRGIYGWEFQIRSASASWQTTESVGDCDFLASYKAQRDGSAIKVRKAVAGPEESGQVIHVSRFDGKAGRCWLDYLKGRELSTVFWDGEAIADAMVTVSLARSAPLAPPVHFTTLLGAGPQPGAFTVAPTVAAKRHLSAAGRIRHEGLRRKYQATPYELPFESLRNASTGSLADALQALNDFRDLLQARPDLAPRVAESLKSPLTPELSGLLAHALELANTEATQRTLADILSNPQDFPPTALAQAIVAAGGLGPLKDSRILEALDTIQSRQTSAAGELPLDDAALFSLSQLANDNPEVREPLVANLTPLLDSGNAVECCTALLAMANARLATPELIGRAEMLLKSPEPRIRAAALACFEFVPELSSTQAAAIGDRLNDDNVAVQLQAVATLAATHQRDPRPENLAALEAITRKSDASGDVQTAARQAIADASAPQ